MPKTHILILWGALLLAACSTPPATPDAAPTRTPTEVVTPTLTVTAAPTRPAYNPGQLVDYTAQTGDTLPSLAGRFNTTVAEIRAANPSIPADATTMPAGFPMLIPIYYRPFWGSQFQILPDWLFVNGPAQSGFNTSDYVNSQPGWLRNYRGSAGTNTISGAELVDLVATNFSISPRLLLALLEYQAGALSDPIMDPALEDYPLGYENLRNRGVYLQMVRAANLLNNAYYSWRSGELTQFERPDGRIYRPDPWQNAASVALQHFYNIVLPINEFDAAISGEGLAATYARLFGDPWLTAEEHIPGSLRQPELRLPFSPGETWSLTGGPHTGWGNGQPWAALDFGPGLLERGCVPSSDWATALADGLVVRTGEGTVVLDLDGDGDEHTGWVIFYLHLAEEGRVPVGRRLEAGQPVGHPSCEGGESTGTHVHVARKYNGEWMLAAGALPFVMENWTPFAGLTEYEGTLQSLGRTITACTCSDHNTAISSTAEPVPYPTPSSNATATPSPTPEE
jgi:murein DD-endopeptidase MepM/ murein hydrolase activator NlpD